MRKTFIAAAGLVFALSGAAFAQSATGNMNNPGSVKSNSEKSMESGSMQGGAMQGGAMQGGAMNRGDMPATTGTAPAVRDGSMGTMPAQPGAAPAAR